VRPKQVGITWPFELPPLSGGERGLMWLLKLQSGLISARIGLTPPYFPVVVMCNIRIVPLAQ
jgi:hypothetical protein